LKNLSLACIANRHEACDGISRKECECGCHIVRELNQSSSL